MRKEAAGSRSGNLTRLQFSPLSPSVAGKKALSPKVQMMKSALSTKRPVQRKSNHQGLSLSLSLSSFESVRPKFRESLSAALVMDSDQQDKKQSAQNSVA
ncbi:hypothetical protein ZWY2020_040827 [Hordeum vulgare]|nr:hypothetical protein ZWY2020_040827 [Hordeum vulgare]